MLKRIGEILGGIFGSAIGLAIMALALLSLPLNIVVWMRWTGWEWWSALFAAIFSQVIPGIGQIVYVIFTLIGLYFFYDAGWDWRQATNPMPKTFSIATLTPDKFEQFKKKALLPNLTQQCMTEAKNRVGVDGKVPVVTAKFCECFAKVAVATTTQSDLAYQESHQGETPGLRERVQSRVRAECARR